MTTKEIRDAATSVGKLVLKNTYDGSLVWTNKKYGG